MNKEKFNQTKDRINKEMTAVAQRVVNERISCVVDFGCVTFRMMEPDGSTDYMKDSFDAMIDRGSVLFRNHISSAVRLGDDSAKMHMAFATAATSQEIADSVKKALEEHKAAMFGAYEEMEVE